MDTLLHIYDELSIAFNSQKSFEKYYALNLKSKSVQEWSYELKNKLFEVHTYLKGALTGAVPIEIVRLWINKVSILKENADTIQFRINNDLQKYLTHSNTPEAIFHEKIIQDNISHTGKSYEELEPHYLRIIEERIKSLQPMQPYAIESYNTIKYALSKMEALFMPVIGRTITIASTNVPAKNKFEEDSTEIPTKNVYTRDRASF